MHYYTRNLGDYAKDAGHLSTLQHGIYSLLMDWYYANERPIPEGLAHSIARLDVDHTGAPHPLRGQVDLVLTQFFTLVDGAWRKGRIDAEIKAYHEKAEKNRKNGQAGGRPRKDGNPVGSQSEPNRNPNQEPETNKSKNPLNPPSGDLPAKEGRKKAAAIELKTYLDSLNGERFVKPGDTILEYASSIELPPVFLKLAFFEFRDRMIESAKKQKDWLKTYRAYIRANYLKLWWYDEANKAWELTTAGKQAWAKHKEML